MTPFVLAGIAISALLLVGGQLLAWRGLGTAARGLAKLRRLAASPLQYRPPSAADPVPPADLMARMTAELQTAGCVMLGDFAEVQADGEVLGVTRWFRDETGEVVGWCGVAGTPPTMPVVALMSETVTGAFVGTIRGPELPRLSWPDWFHVLQLAWEPGMSAALALHRAKLQQLNVPLVRAQTAAEAQALMNRRIVRTSEWRASRPAEELREEDVRAAVGLQHADLAGPLLRRLRKLEGAG